MSPIGRNSPRNAREVPNLQWANGKNEARSTPGKGRFFPFVGWYVEVGRDEAFDRFAKEADIPQIEIRHSRVGAEAEIVRHWNLGDSVRFFPVTRGPVALTVAASLSPENLARTMDAGIGLRWNRNEGNRSRLAVRGYPQVMRKDVWLTYPGLVQISVRSRMSDKLLAALVDHVRVCETADTLVDRNKHPNIIECYELALPLGPGNEEEWGKGETATVTPIVSLHPQTIHGDYLQTIWRPSLVVELAQCDWPEIQTWAHEFSLAPSASSEGFESSEGGIAPVLSR